jgi:hypothetical protein
MLNVQKTATCWNWHGYLSRGYGQIMHDGVRMGVHRAAYLILVGAIPEGMNVCHACDNRRCVNPQHLWLGTTKDNIRDCVAKGRSKEQKKTHCPRGHEYTPENTVYIHNGARNCRKCRREASRAVWERRGGKEAYNAYMREYQRKRKATSA